MPEQAAQTMAYAGEPTCFQQELWPWSSAFLRTLFGGMEPHWRSSSRTVSSRKNPTVGGECEDGVVA